MLMFISDHCQVSTFTAMRSENYFRNPLDFHPERWLPPDHHPLYDTRYADDNLKPFFPSASGLGSALEKRSRSRRPAIS